MNGIDQSDLGRVLSEHEEQYQRIIGEILKCNPIPASDGRLEPPWEVVAPLLSRMAELAKAAREALEIYDECGSINWKRMVKLRTALSDSETLSVLRGYGG